MFILGNGPTRKQFDVKRMYNTQLRQLMYGCNAIYREYTEELPIPDLLFAIDDGMIKEIMESDFPKNRFVITPEDEKWEPPDCNPNRPRSNAGMVAMQYALKHHPMMSHMYCIGFDFLLTDVNLGMGNIYDGTKNYGVETRCHPSDFQGRFNFLKFIVKQYPHVKFMFGFPSGSEAYSIENAPNFKIVSFDTIYKMVEEERI